MSTPQQAPPLPTIAEARAYLRQRVEDVSAGRAAGRFLTPADLAAALVVLDALDSHDRLDRLLGTVERAATALEALISRGGQLVALRAETLALMRGQL